MNTRLALLLAPVLLTGAGLLPVGPAEAATTYSAGLRTAVQHLPVAAEQNAGYDRSRYFGTWRDNDGDCQNSRHEVLIAEGSNVRLASSGCTVVAGRWRSFYDAQTYTHPRSLQVDHLVPVAEAWGSGAQSWTQARRVSFYNDLGVGYALNAIPSALNQAKRASGPEQWMPPANRCRYVEVWVAMKHRWGLRVDVAERDALVRYAASCPDNPITVRRV